MQIEVAGIKTADGRLLDRQQIEVDAVIKLVARVPTVLLYLRLQVGCLFIILSRYLAQTETSGNVGHGLQFLIHKGVEEY